jgi:hypothetical protein
MTKNKFKIIKLFPCSITTAMKSKKGSGGNVLNYNVRGEGVKIQIIHHNKLKLQLIMNVLQDVVWFSLLLSQTSEWNIYMQSVI